MGTMIGTGSLKPTKEQFYVQTQDISKNLGILNSYISSDKYTNY